MGMANIRISAKSAAIPTITTGAASVRGTLRASSQSTNGSSAYASRNAKKRGTRTPRRTYARVRPDATVASTIPRRKPRPESAVDGGGADVVDIRRRQCSLPGAMPEAKPALPDGPEAGRLDPAKPPPFDERANRVVPPMQRQDGSTLVRLVGVMRRLLGPGGCPWDQEQTYETLRKYVLEEACEVIDAIDSDNRVALREELGDLLLQVVFQAELGRREGSFAIDDVIEGIVAKLVYRHPHVFGDASGHPEKEFASAAD